MSNPRDFNVGDVVQLRSGGPPMTVRDVDAAPTAHTADVGEIACHWFSGSRLEWGRFSPAELVLLEPTEQELA